MSDNSGVDTGPVDAAQGSLHSTEALMLEALKMAKAGHWEYDFQADQFTFNDAFYEVFHTCAEKAGGYHMSAAEYAERFVHPDDAHLVAEVVKRSIETDDPNFSTYIEHRIVYSDGGVGHIAVRVSIIKYAEGVTVKSFGINQDITELLALEKHFRQSENLRVLGQMAGGIAHDFNNCLMPIVGLSDFLVQHEEVLSDTREARQMLRHIATAARDARHIVKRLRLVRGTEEEEEYRLIDVNELAKRVSELTSPRWKEEMSGKGLHVEMKFDLAEVPPIRGSGTELREGLVNLVFNACDAMPEGGTITISTGTEGYRVLIDVADTG